MTARDDGNTVTDLRPMAGKDLVVSHNQRSKFNTIVWKLHKEHTTQDGFLKARTPQPQRSRRLRGQEPSPERVVGSTASSPFGGPISPNGVNPSPFNIIVWKLHKELTTVEVRAKFADTGFVMGNVL